MKPKRQAARRDSAGATPTIVKIVLLYAVFATLWILLSDKLISLIFSDPASIITVSTLKGWAFVVVTSLLLFVLMRRLLDHKSADAVASVANPSSTPSVETMAVEGALGQDTASETMAVEGALGQEASARFTGVSLRALLTWPFFLLVIVIAALMLSGVSYTFHQQKNKEIARLQAIANLKTDQISDWLRERTEDVQLIQSSHFLAELYWRWRTTDDAASREQLRKRLQQYQDIYRYQSIMVFDEQGEGGLATENTIPVMTSRLRATVQQALAEDRVLNTGLYRGEEEQSALHLDFVAPLPTIEGRFKSALVLHTNPALTFYPMLQAWPVPSVSGETLLFRRDGDSVLFLNELRHRSDTAVKLRIPVAEPRLLAAQVLRGDVKLDSIVEGIEGLDYRQTPAIGVAKRVPGTDWFLLAKLDQSELYAPAWWDAVWVALASMMALFAVAVATILIHQNRELRFSLLQRRQQAERLRILQQLAAERSRLRTLIQTIPDLVWLKDPKGVYLICNSVFERFFGAKEADIVGKTDYDFMAAEWADFFRQKDREAIAADRPNVNEEWITFADDGRRVLLETIKTPMRDAEGELVGVLGVSRDITALHEQLMLQDQIARIAATVPGLIYSLRLRANGGANMLYASPALQTLCGLRPEEIAKDASPLFALIHPEDRARIQARIAESARALTQWRDEFRVRNLLKGDEIWIEGRAMPVAESAGDVLLHGYLQDITERKQAEAALRESELRVRAKLDSLLAPEGDIGALELSDILDIPALQTTLEQFFKLVPISAAILNLEGRILAAIGWQDICTQFHRVHPAARQNCLESDTVLSCGVTPGTWKIYRCKNHMYDVATPIVMGGRHLGNLFVGQFFFDDEPLERELFRAQARQYGFDEQDYLAALERTPRWSRDKISAIMDFYARFTQLFSTLSYSNVKLARSVAERDALLKSLKESEERFRSLFENSPVAYQSLDSEGRFIDVNRRLCDLLGYQPDELLGRRFGELWSDDIQASFPKAFGKFKHDRRISSELHLIRKNGWAVNVILEGRVQLDSQGNFVRTHCILTDITGRKRMEDALRESESRFRTTLRSVGDGLITTDAESRVAFMNLMAETLTGWSLEEAYGKPLSEVFVIINEETRQPVENPVAHVLREGVVIGLANHTLLISRDGIERPIADSGAPIRADQGHIVGVVLVFRDQTEERAATRALRESERLKSDLLKKLNEAQRCAKIGSWDWDRVHDTVWWSGELYRIFELSPAEFAPSFEANARYIHPDDIDAYYRAFKNAVKNSGILNFDLRIVTKNGIVKYCNAQGIVERGQEGQPTRIFGTLMDITERRRMEDALRESEAMYRSLFKNMLNGFAYCQMLFENKQPQDFIYLSVNDAFETLTGLQDVVGKKVSEVIPGIRESDPELFEIYGRVALAGQSERFETYLKALRQWFWVSVYSPKKEYFVVVFDVITERKQAEAEILCLNADLERRVAERTAELAAAKNAAEVANRAKSAFLANMSHEIRTPLNAITGLAHLLQRSVRDPDAWEKLRKVQDAAQHLLRILNDILDLSKIESGKLVLEQTNFELDSVLNNVCALVTQKAQAKGLELVVEIDPSLTTVSVLRGDPTRLTQLLLNYLSNAVKFTHRGVITLRGRVVEDSAVDLLLRFEVQDTGIGIAPEHLARLFETFEQADDSTTRQYGGTGLGLAINRRLAQLLGGAVGVKSELGVGSTFWFTAQLSKSAQAPARRADHQLRGQRALLADDLPEARAALGAMLRALELQVETVNSGAAALDAITAANARGEPFDWVLLDWRMPELDGLETARRLQNLPLTHRPVGLLVTAYDAQDMRDIARQAGLRAVLIKPVTLSTLHDALRQALDNRDRVIPVTPAVSTAEQALIQHHRGAQLLLAEDNLINQEVALDLLREVGFAVDLAENGREAVTKAQANAYDLILMDVQMPELDGLEATRAIRRLPGHEQTPILAMTANAFGEDRAQCLEAGMNDHVGKPVDPEVLFAMLLKWLPKRPEQPPHSSQPTVIAALSASSSPDDENLARLAAIPGLDPRLGLKLIHGQIDTYMRLLRQFMDGHKRDMADLRDCLGAGDWTTARRLAHSLKGTTSLLGATRLQALATALDVAIRDSQPVAEIEHLCAVVESEQAALAAALLALPKEIETPPEPVVDWERARAALAELEALLAEDNIQATNVMRAAAPLLRAALGENVAALERQIASFDFEQALDTLRALVAKRPEWRDAAR